MSISVSKKSDLDFALSQAEPSSSSSSKSFLLFKKNLNKVQIPNLAPFQLRLFERYFMLAENERTFPEQREKFQNLIESRLTLLSKKILNASNVLKLRYSLLRTFDEALNMRKPVLKFLDGWIDGEIISKEEANKVWEPILKFLDGWIERELISKEEATEIIKLVKASLFLSLGEDSAEEERSPAKISKSLCSKKLLSFKRRARLLDDHIALFLKVIEVIGSARIVDRRKEFDSFLDEFLSCLENQNQIIKDFHINQVQIAIILEHRARKGLLLDDISKQRTMQTTPAASAQIERCAATPKYIISSARYWYTRAFDELIQDRDPFSCFLDYLLDQDCASFGSLEQLWRASREVNKRWNDEMHEKTKHHQMEQRFEIVQIHIGSRFDQILQAHKFPFSQEMLIDLYARFFHFPCPPYLSCFIRLIKESAQEFELNGDQSIQMFMESFGLKPGNDLLSKLCELNPSLKALYSFHDHFHDYPGRFISVFSQLSQENIFDLAKGYIEGGPDELRLLLSKMPVDSKSAEKFLSVFAKSS